MHKKLYHFACICFYRPYHNRHMDALTSSIISICIIFGGSAIGSALVFFFKKDLSDKMNNLVLGFASGIMIAAGIFGLLIPSIEEAQKSSIYASFPYVPVLIGFFIGSIILYAIDKIVPHLHHEGSEEEGIKTNKLGKHTKLFFAVLIHNIPEGLAVGFACGLTLASPSLTTAMAALSLAIGITIQNIPESFAVAVPLYANGMKKSKAFFLALATGIVEPIFAIVGLFLAFYIEPLLPWLLSFASGAMIYVTVDELLPEARKGAAIHYGLWAFIIGFMIMLALEVIPINVI